MNIMNNEFSKDMLSVANVSGGSLSYYDTDNIKDDYLYNQKIALFNDMRNKINKINDYLDEGCNYLKNGGCVFGNKTFVESEVNDCKATIELIKNKCNEYIQYLEQSKNKVK